MNMQHKAVPVGGLQVIDEQKGIVEAIVSVTGIVDEVRDVIKPGAYAKTLAKRVPKGVFNHDWNVPIAKTLDVKELMPGDPELPKLTATGMPWPSEAGALKVKMQFNLSTQRGRETYADVVFYGDEQQWSIGYQVPTGGSTVNSKTGHRDIDMLELYEYSPVLFGAMPLAVTQSVKTAQAAYRAAISAGASASVKEGGADRNRGGAEKLRRYWTVGAGGQKIRWGVPGDFMRCVGLVSEHMTVERAKGYCALRHKETTGEWAGVNAHGGKKSLSQKTLNELEAIGPEEMADLAEDQAALESAADYDPGMLVPEDPGIAIAVDGKSFDLRLTRAFDRTEIDSMSDEVVDVVETKVGRQLSASNASRIRAAVSELLALLESAGVMASTDSEDAPNEDDMTIKSTSDILHDMKMLQAQLRL